MPTITTKPTTTSRTVSTNIERDVHHDIHYITTPNTLGVFNRIVFGYQTGQHSFNIIGSYGTGKSSFLWALEKNLTEGVPYFAPLNGQFNHLKKFTFFKVIGNFSSLRQTFSERLGLEKKATDADIFRALDDLYAQVKTRNEVFILVVDEFGKFLEYASQNNPYKELYFIQQLAEWVNDLGRNALLLTVLHQNFAAYSYSLPKDQRKEWEKVKGRLIDISFDEPIEQLLLLVAKRIEELPVVSPTERWLEPLLQLFEGTKLISTATLDRTLAKRLFPLDYLSAYVLAQALQRYGQNERSLFTFLASQEKYGLLKFNSDEQPYYSVSHVFTYLTQNLSQEINSRDNPHRATWKAIFEALDRADTLNHENYDALKAIIQCIGLINLFGKSLGKLDASTLAQYLEHAVGIEGAEELIELLIEKKIIRFYHHKNKLFFFNGTDVDIEQELVLASQRLDSSFSVAERISYYLTLPTLMAKRVQYQKGTPRFFTLRVVDTDETRRPEGEIDGYINIFLSEARIKGKIKELSKEKKEAQIFVLVNKFQSLKTTIFEIEKINAVIKKHTDDKVAKGILLSERQHEFDKLKALIDQYIYDPETHWYFQGKRYPIQSRHELNVFLSEVVEQVYTDCPTYRNEMVNKEHLSSPILTARKALIKDVYDRQFEEDLGYEASKFPPQKSIYLSLLKATGIHRQTNGVYGLHAPSDKSFDALWQACERFLNSTRTIKRSVEELYELLLAPPFKLKKGLVDFWIPLYLLIQNEEYALFHHSEGYIPYVTPETLDLLTKKPSNYSIKTYQVEGVKLNLYQRYKEITGIQSPKKGLESTFIAIFSNFMNFYASLPSYAKHTNQLSPMAKGFRTAIGSASDPEEALFETFPQALGFGDYNLRDDNKQLTAFVKQLNEAIFELRSAYANLLERFERTLLKAFGLGSQPFVTYKEQIQQRLSSLHPDWLITKQKQLFKRLVSPLEDRESWLKSVADAVLGSSIDQLDDEQEASLMRDTITIVHDLEKLIGIHELKSQRSDDEIFRLDILNSRGEKLPDHIILPSNRRSEIADLQQQIEAVLLADVIINKAAIISVMQKLVQHG